MPMEKGQTDVDKALERARKKVAQLEAAAQKESQRKEIEQLARQKGGEPVNCSLVTSRESSDSRKRSAEESVQRKGDDGTTKRPAKELSRQKVGDAVNRSLVTSISQDGSDSQKRPAKQPPPPIPRPETASAISQPPPPIPRPATASAIAQPPPPMPRPATASAIELRKRKPSQDEFMEGTTGVVGLEDYEDVADFFNEAFNEEDADDSDDDGSEYDGATESASEDEDEAGELG
jgi:hypothetical protein